MTLWKDLRDGDEIAQYASNLTELQDEVMDIGMACGTSMPHMQASVMQREIGQTGDKLA